MFIGDTVPAEPWKPIQVPLMPSTEGSNLQKAIFHQMDDVDPQQLLSEWSQPPPKKFSGLVRKGPDIPSVAALQSTDLVAQIWQKQSINGFPSKLNNFV
mmetsp:Transcript_31561/g.86998  ORF Transcript_31561/g.86998 Transcript_31561/m.86998 type:complete len:99 (+) Transcript_31561:1703-1999(+)